VTKKNKLEYSNSVHWWRVVWWATITYGSGADQYYLVERQAVEFIMILR